MRRYFVLPLLLVGLVYTASAGKFPQPDNKPDLRRQTPTIIVNTLADDPRGCPENCTLRSAINSAVAGDVIGFSSDLSGTLTLVQPIEISQPITILGPGADKLSIVMDNAIEDFMLKILAENVVIQGLALRDGFGIQVTGNNAQLLNITMTGHKTTAIVLLQELALLIQDSLFENNTDEFGGALSLGSYTQVTILNSTFRQNIASANGGAISCYDDGGYDASGNNYGYTTFIQIENSLFEANEAGQEGGAISAKCTMHIKSSQFIRNQVLGIFSVYFGDTLSQNPATGRGGAIANQNWDMVIENSVFTENSTATTNGNENSGGAIYSTSPYVIANSTFQGNQAKMGGAISGSSGGGENLIINSTFMNNTAEEQGGALYASASVYNTTFTQNQAQEGGAIYIADQAAFVMGSTIVSGNTARSGPDVRGVVESYGYNLISNPRDSSGWFASDLRDIDPMLGELTVENGLPVFPLQVGSPAIDGGGTECYEFDQRGAARQGACDIGAYEVSNVTAVVSPTLLSPTSVPDTTNPTATPIPADTNATPDMIGTAVAATMSALISPTPTPAATETPDVIATYVAATLTALVPTESAALATLEPTQNLALATLPEESGNAATFTPSPTIRPTATPRPTDVPLPFYNLSSAQERPIANAVAEAGFADDFDDRTYNWGTSDSGTIINDKLWVTAPDNQFLYWSFIPTNFNAENFVMQVDISSPNNTPYGCGIVFRFQDDDDFYHLVVSPLDNLFSLWKRENGNIIPLADWMDDISLNIDFTVGGTNRVVIWSQGGQMEVYINGVFMVDRRDTTHKRGQIGFTTESYSESSVTCQFDNLIVIKNPDSDVLSVFVPF